MMLRAKKRSGWPWLMSIVLLDAWCLTTALHAEPAKLMVLLPFSSVYKHLGMHAKNGFLLGLDQEAFTLNVNHDAWITLEFLDTRADRKHALTLAQQAVAGGAQAILGIISGDVVLALKDYVLREAHIP